MTSARAAGPARASPSPPRPAGRTWRTAAGPAELDAEIARSAAPPRGRRWAARSATRPTRCWCRVRSGAKFSMPGMMDTVLNIGLNDESVAGPGRAVGQRALRLGLLPPLHPDVRQDRARHRRASASSDALEQAKADAGVAADVDLAADDLQRAGRAATRRSSASAPAHDVPAGPARAARRCAIEAVFRLLEHRPRPALPPPGAHPRRPRHRRQRAGHGVRQPRRATPAPASPSPATRRPGAPGVYGDYLPNAQGEDVVAGIRNTLPLADLAEARPGAARRAACASCTRSRRTTATCATSSSPSSRASCGCCRPASASARPQAAFRIAVDLVDEGLIDMDEALRRVSAAPSSAS